MTEGKAANKGPSSDDIISALDQTGFIFEYRVAQKLRKLGCETFLNDPFTDPETGKLREVDVIAHLTKTVTADNLRLITSAILIVECKKYDDPLLILGEEDTFYGTNVVLSFDPPELGFPQPLTEHIIYKLTHWENDETYRPFFIGTQLIKMRRQNGKWMANNEAVYDSIVYPLAKATARQGERLRANADRGDSQSARITYKLAPTLDYLFPILITSGDIYTVNVTGNEKPSVERASWTRLVRQFDSGPFQMDIVSFMHLENYIGEKINPTLVKTLGSLESHINFFDLKWLQDTYGTE